MAGVKFQVLKASDDSPNATIRVPGVDTFVARWNGEAGVYEMFRLYAVEKLGEVKTKPEVLPWLKKYVATLLVAKAKAAVSK